MADRTYSLDDVFDRLSRVCMCPTANACGGGFGASCPTAGAMMAGISLANAELMRLRTFEKTLKEASPLRTFMPPPPREYRAEYNVTPPRYVGTIPRREDIPIQPKYQPPPDEFRFEPGKPLYVGVDQGDGESKAYVALYRYNTRADRQCLGVAEVVDGNEEKALFQAWQEAGWETLKDDSRLMNKCLAKMSERDLELCKRLEITPEKCCERAGEYNGYGSDGPSLFECPKGCSCHD